MIYVLIGKYDEMADLWSCGTIMYLILCGSPPFTADDPKQTIEVVKKGVITWEESEWKHIFSERAAILIYACNKICV